ncbi:uroporphyrinogen-III decarboxylase-like protein [Candidatus Binatia bacterium]|nr:uroporphyrinogen-III decarboxylase-like protein [Candidatus Binatia bacterium]
MTHTPDFANLRRTILRQGPPGPVPLFEIFADTGMVEAVLGERFPIDLRRFIEEPSPTISAEELPAVLTALDMYVRFCRDLGYDYVFTTTGFNLRRSLTAAADTTGARNWADGQRYWQDEAGGPIQSWRDFETYPWPTPESLSHPGLDYVSAVVPEGMKVAAFVYGGVFEVSTWLMGLQSFSFALADEPDLVAAIAQRVGELATATARQVTAIDNVEMLVFTDDLGFFSGPLVSPAVVRRYMLPHYKAIAEAVHAAGKLFVFHSCGNMYGLMDDLIDTVGIDAKHSFEDKILPVDEAYARWGDRTAILGGVDMDLLGRGTVEQVRARTRQILDRCAASGTGYCLGTGNTAANYVPKENYLAMLDEGRRWNREHFGTE